MKRTLTLKSEALSDLTSAELTDVVGAAAAVLPTTPVDECTYTKVLCPTRRVSCTC